MPAVACHGVIFKERRLPYCAIAASCDVNDARACETYAPSLLLPGLSPPAAFSAIARCAYAAQRVCRRSRQSRVPARAAYAALLFSPSVAVQASNAKWQQQYFAPAMSEQYVIDNGEWRRKEFALRDRRRRTIPWCGAARWRGIKERTCHLCSCRLPVFAVEGGAARAAMSRYVQQCSPGFLPASHAAVHTATFAPAAQFLKNYCLPLSHLPLSPRPCPDRWRSPLPALSALLFICLCL